MSRNRQNVVANKARRRLTWTPTHNFRFLDIKRLLERFTFTFAVTVDSY